jgi:hypothetical protein
MGLIMTPSSVALEKTLPTPNHVAEFPKDKRGELVMVPALHPARVQDRRVKDWCLELNHERIHQRNGRIDRLGQKNETELIDLVADHPSERRARDRLLKKDELRGILTSSMEGLDDTGLAAYLNKARMEREPRVRHFMP